jgi:adenylylsulfate kinase-like enzyme
MICDSPLHTTGRVLWITGLSGSGKSTLATEVVRQLRALRNDVIRLDGDELREVFAAKTINLQRHDRNGRLMLAMQYASFCRLLSMQGFTVVIATISMFREVYAWNRTHLPGYFEVYLKVPIAEVRRRDPKGIYRRFDAGELNNVAGLDLSIDEPDAADCIVEFDPGRTVTKLADELIQILSTRK